MQGIARREEALVKAGDRIRTDDIYIGNRRLPSPGTRKRCYRRGLQIARGATDAPESGRFWTVARCTPRSGRDILTLRTVWLRVGWRARAAQGLSGGGLCSLIHRSHLRIEAFRRRRLDQQGRQSVEVE